MERHFFRFSRALNARKRKIFALFFALAASIGLSYAATEVTITNNDFPGMDVSFTKDGVTVSADWIDNMQSGNLVGPGSFSTTLGNFTKIEVNAGEVLQLGEGWSGNFERQTWTGNASSVSFSGEIYGVGHGITLKFTIEAAAPAREPQRYTEPVKIEDLMVGDTLAMGAKMNSDQYFLFYCAPNRARRHGNLWTSDFESFFLGSADAISKHGAIDLENPDGLRGCLEPVNENGELAEEWMVTSTNPFTIAGIGKAEITNHSYNSDVDYAALEPGDTITFGATILNTPEKVWFLANRMQRIFSSGEISIIDDDRWINSYGTIGKNGVIKADNYGTTQVPINEQGTLGGKWVVKFYSPLTIAGIGYPMPTLTLSDKVSIVGMPVAGIKDIGNDNYEVEPGTQFQIQAAVPEHYSLVGWSDLASTDPNYTANPRTITLNSDSTIQPIYAIDTYTLTLGVNDESRGSVKIAPGMKKSVWDKEFLNNMYIWVQMMPSSAPHVEHNNNEKDNIRIEGQPMQTEVMWYYTTYFDPKGSSYIYMYEAGKAQFLFGFINGHHTFQRIEIYSTEGSNQYDGGWEYNTEKGCYQTTATEPFDMASLVLAEGQGVYLPVDSLIFYVPSELPEGVVPTETPGVYTVDWGTELTFIATPASEDYYLAKWNDEPATSDTLKLTMNGELTVNATFAHVPYIYTLPEGVSIVEPMPAGITAKGEGIYEIVEGTEFQISADIIPEHYHFGHWADLNSEDEQYAANPRTIVASENLTIEPIFAIDTYTLTLATNDSTKGVVSVIGAGQGDEPQPTTVTFTNLNNVVKVVENITLPHTFSCDYTNGNGELDLIIQESYNDTGHCDNSRSPWGGTDNEVVVGQDGNNHFVTINAPFVGTSFMSGYYDGSSFGNFYYSFHITTAAAAPAAASGIVDNGDGTYTVDYGTELTFVAKPAEDFMLESWSNGAEVTSDTLKLTMTEELSLTANFKHIPATITLPEGVNIVEPMPAGITSKGEGVYEVEYGTEFQISADIIPEHYHFGHWADLDAEDAMYAANPRTIVASENLTIEPIFAIDTYTLTLATNDSTKGVVSLEGAGQGGEPEPFAQLIVPESWSSEVGVTITAADLPGFVASTEEAVKALPVPTEGSVFVIYNFKEGVDPSGGAGNASVEAVTFENGEYVRTTSSPVDHANASYYSNQGMIFLYTTAAGQAGQGGEGEEPEGIVDNGDGTYTVDWGTELTFTAKAADGYHVQSWSNGAEVNDLVEATQTITMTEALDLSALFAENPIITLATNDSTMGIVTLAGAGKQLTVAGSNMDVNQNIPIRPVSSTDTRTMNQSIYPAALLTGIAGESISGMTYYISEPGAHVLTATYVVKLMETEQAAFSDAVAVNTESATTVYTGTIDVTGNTLDIVFDQPYAYNGGNLLVEFSISSASHQNALAKFSVFASQGGSFQQYYNFGFEEMRYYTYDFLAKTTFICGDNKGIPGVIDLGNGQYNVLPGTELTFVAQPAERFMLDSWSNGAPVNGDSLTITVTEPMSLTANFKYIPAVITLPEGVNIVEPMPEGITAKGEGVYEVEHGTEFQITAVGAPEHYHFDHWADLSAEDAQYYANPRTVVADTNFIANPFYTIDTYTITLASNDTTMGKLTIEPAEGIVKNDDSTYTIDWGTEVTFVAVPAEDYHLLSWSNGAEVTEDNKQTLTITDELSLSAFFKHDTYILTVKGAEVEIAKFYDGTNTAVVTNPGTLVGVQEGDSVKLTTTATFSSADIANNLDITLHYAIEVIDGGIYDNEYALAVTDSLYDKKGFIIEPMIPDTTAAPQEEEAEVKEGIEVYGYGYCADGDMTGMLYHLKQGNPNQYKVEFEDARFDDVDWTNLDEKGPEGVIYVTVPVDVPTGDYKMTVTFRDHTEFYSLESEPISITFHVNLPETYVVALFDNVMAVVDTCECLTDIQWYWRANSTDQWQAIEGATGYYYKQEGGLSGEYFIKAKMNGVDTYTCPQDDMTLYGDTKQAKVSAYPNPVVNTTTVTIENSYNYEHTLRVVNLMGNEMMTTSFEGNETTVDMGGFVQGNYMISVDGIVVKVMKK